MAEQRALIEFRSAGDTGVDDPESVQPVKNVEPADEIVFARPTENLRRRTENLRGVVQDLLYYRDYSDLIVELTTGGSIAWGGPTSTGGTGIVTVTGTLKVSPRAAPAAPVRGFLSIGTPSSNQITYAIGTSGYATHGTNGITIEHRSASGQALSVNVSPGPHKHILVFFDAANAAHTTSAVKNLVDSAIAADGLLAGKLFTTVSGAGVIAATAELLLSASADDESHWVAGTLITALTTSRKLNVGDGVAIWYKYTIEPTTDPTDPKGSVAGGRAESSITRGNHNIPAGSLFITSDEVRKIPGAIVLFRVALGGQLILLDGTRIAAGETHTLSSVNAQIDAKGFATQAYANNAATTAANAAVSNRATTSYVDTAVANGIATRTTPTTVDQKIATAFQNYTPPASGTSTSDVNNLINSHYTNTSVPQRDQAIQNALAAVSAGAPRSFTAVISSTSGGDHNGSTACNAIFDATYTNASAFYVRRGIYSVTTTTTVSTTRDVVAEDATFTIASNVGGFITLNGYYENCTFATQGSGYFRAEGKLTLRNCTVYANAFAVVAGTTLICENVRFIGLRNLAPTWNTYAGLYLPANVGGAFINCTFGDPVVQNGWMLSIYGPSTTACALLFENCTFAANASYGVSGMVVNQETGLRRIQFRNCMVTSTGTAEQYGIYLVNTGNTSFDGCTVTTEGCTALYQYLSSVTYEDCVFTAGDGAAAHNNGQAVYISPQQVNYTGAISPENAQNATSIRNCTINIGEGIRTLTGSILRPAVSIGRYSTEGGISNGADGFYEAPIYVDGLLVRYKQRKVAAYRGTTLILAGSRSSVQAPNIYRNVVLDMNHNYADHVGNGSYHIMLQNAFVQAYGFLPATGADKGIASLIVDGLTLNNVSAPSANTARHYLGAVHARLSNVNINAVPCPVTAQSCSAAPVYLRSCSVDNLMIHDAQHINVLLTYILYMLGDAYRHCRVNGGALSGHSGTVTCFVGLGDHSILEGFHVAARDATSSAISPAMLVQYAGGYNLMSNCMLETDISSIGSYAIISLSSGRHQHMRGCTVIGQANYMKVKLESVSSQLIFHNNIFINRQPAAGNVVVPYVELSNGTNVEIGGTNYAERADN